MKIWLTGLLLAALALPAVAQDDDVNPAINGPTMAVECDDALRAARAAKEAKNEVRETLGYCVLYTLAIIDTAGSASEFELAGNKVCIPTNLRPDLLMSQARIIGERKRAGKAPTYATLVLEAIATTYPCE